MARRFSLFRRSQPPETADASAPETPANNAGFGFVTFGSEEPPLPAEDVNKPYVFGSLPNPPDSGGGTSVAVEELTLAHEGLDASGGKMEVYGFSHEVQSPRDSAAPGETIQIHGQYDMDTTVAADPTPFAMKDLSDGPSASANLVQGEVVALESNNNPPDDVSEQILEDLDDVLIQ